MISIGWEIVGYNMILIFGDGVFRSVFKIFRIVYVWVLCLVVFGYIVFGLLKMVNYIVLSVKLLKSCWMFKRLSKVFKYG